MDTIGERIRYHRNIAQLGLAKLSKACGISRCNLSKIESNAIVPTYAAITAIAEYFKVSVDWLIFGDCPPVGPIGSFAPEIKEIFDQLSRLDKKRQALVMDFISFELRLQEGKEL